MPGVGKLTGDGQVSSVAGLSCWSPGNCTVIGNYYTIGNDQNVFLAQQVNGTWHAAVRPPGTAALAGESIIFTSITCSPDGYCAAGGSYDPGYGDYLQDAFIMTESDGTWQDAQEVSGLDTTDGSGFQVTSVSCPSAGNCTAAGQFLGTGEGTDAFVVDEVDGVWGSAQDPFYDVTQSPVVSCASAGNCLASVGEYVAVESGGTWGTPQALAGEVDAVSCAPDGECTATYVGPGYQPQVVSETGGVWGTAAVLAGIGPLDGGYWAQIDLLACTSGDNCQAGGTYENGNTDGPVPFLASEINGTWKAAQASNVAISGISCPSAGDCGIVGIDGVVSQSDGIWGAPRVTTDVLSSISCAAPGFCTAAGISGSEYNVVGISEETATSTQLALTAAKVPYGDEDAEHLSVAVASKAGGTPNGAVTIAQGRTTICTVTLSAGKGNCTLPATRFSPGAYGVTASYPGAAPFLPSTAAAKTLTVTKAKTVTRIALSAGSVTFGHENSLHISVSVSPQYGGAPSGKVTVKAGSTAICAITLKSQKGTCTLTAKRLNAGSYAVTAAFGGNADFLASISARKTLRISR